MHNPDRVFLIDALLILKAKWVDAADGVVGRVEVVVERPVPPDGIGLGEAAGAGVVLVSTDTMIDEVTRHLL